MINILIADEHPEIRQGLKLILADHGGFAVVGEATTEQEVMQRVRECACDILILDMSISGRSGINLIKQIKTEKPKLPILIFSTHEERQYVLSTLKAGASGYLTKNSDPKKLIAAIRELGANENYISQY